MIKIDKKIINSMVKIWTTPDQIEYNNLCTRLQKIDNNFFYNVIKINTLIRVVNEIDNINNIEKLYIYEPDEIIDIFFGDSISISFKNNIITSLFNWLDSDQTKARWIECNLFCLASNRKLYDKVFNVNDSYFLSTIDLNKLTLSDIKC